MHHPPQEIRILNKIVSVNEHGLTYEADPRHTDLLMSSLDLTEANSSSTPGVKPTDRDDLADKVDEPSNTKLDDYSDPNAVIASILSDSNGRRCDTWQTVENNDGIFTRIHGVFRKALTHPADVMKNVDLRDTVFSGKPINNNLR